MWGYSGTKNRDFGKHFHQFYFYKGKEKTEIGKKEGKWHLCVSVQQ